MGDRADDCATLIPFRASSRDVADHALTLGLERTPCRQLSHFFQDFVAIERLYSPVDLAYPFFGDPDPLALKSGIVSIQPFAKLLALRFGQLRQFLKNFGKAHSATLSFSMRIPDVEESWPGQAKRMTNW
jgi:hypothetical protein